MKRSGTGVDVVPEVGWLARAAGRQAGRVPGGAKLAVPGRALAAHGRWNGGGPARAAARHVLRGPATDPAGRHRAQERIAPDPSAVVLEIAQYGETACLCYRSPSVSWQSVSAAMAKKPWLAWAGGASGREAAGDDRIVHRPQDPRAGGRAGGGGCRPDAAEAGALGVAGAVAGSLVLGLASPKGAIDAAIRRTSWPI